MKVIMYGAEICKDCVAAKRVLQQQEHIELDYRNITETTTTLKEFLAYRDHEEMFGPVKEKGKIGIPFFLLEDGTKTLELTDFISNVEPTPINEQNACSIDGKGQC